MTSIVKTWQWETMHVRSPRQIEGQLYAVLLISTMFSHTDSFNITHESNTQQCKWCYMMLTSFITEHTVVGPQICSLGRVKCRHRHTVQQRQTIPAAHRSLQCKQTQSTYIVSPLITDTRNELSVTFDALSIMFTWYIVNLIVCW